jgi:hypothetical protein
MVKNQEWDMTFCCIFYRENLRMINAWDYWGYPIFGQTRLWFGLSTECRHVRAVCYWTCFFFLGLWCLRQQWQKDLGSTAQPVPSARVVRIGGRNECFQGFARTSNSKMQFQAARHHWRVKIGSKWGIGLLQIFSCRMDCHDCWCPFWMVPVVPARGGAEVALGL